MAKVVFSYSHTDEGLRNELEKHLSPLKRMGKIETWHDRRINPGDVFEEEISQNFAEADIVLLLVSNDFIASNYCYEIEMQNSLKRHEHGEAIVIPVILRPCAWHQLPFGKLLAATADGKPIVKYTHIDDGFVEVVNAVSNALDKMNLTSSTSMPVSSKLDSSNSSVKSSFHQGPRSSNLAIKKEFTDRDKDAATRAGFDYVSRFFENSLNELTERNAGLEFDFQRRDSNSFECSVYVSGKRSTHCGIWKDGSGFGDIYYSNSGLIQGGYNESMSISDDGVMLGFKALMGSFTGENRDELMTDQGMAEHFWNQFIHPLK
tara:strand:+ start:92 stop:1048 length:957 start_codon:yes stop_codon:yes gene_type:complete